MKLLLDTHTLLWFALGDQRCSPKARQLIEDPTNDLAGNVVVPNEPLTVPEGTRVTIEIATPDIGHSDPSMPPRQGGWLKAQVTIFTCDANIPLYGVPCLLS